MPTDDQLYERMSEEMHALAAGITPRADLAARAVRRRRAERRRARAIGAGTAAAVAAGAVIAGTGALGGSPRGPRLGPGARLGHLQARLAGYRFSLPRDATSVAASSADCALRATVASPEPSDVGATDPAQPAVASAVLGDGGCVSMLLTTPYDPSSPNAPKPAFPVLDESAISIAGDAGTVGTYEFMGEATNGQGVPLNGARNVELTLEIPVANGQDELLLIAAAGVSEPQLQQIVASGLQGAGASARTRR